MTNQEAINFLNMHKSEEVWADDIAKAIDIAIKALKSQKIGKWIEHEDWYDTYYECSSCGEAFSLIEGTPEDNEYNYCPNCGADMRGEEE